MPLYILSDEQLNYLKFATIVLDEFPEALRKTFVSLWDNRYAGPPTNPLWDDSVAVRNQLKAQEGGTKCKIPTNQSYKDWDCSALFQATIFADSFKLPDATGHLKTLSDLYVRPLPVPSRTLHTAVKSGTGNHNETCALAIDQLRRLRNTACHQASTQNIDKKTFDLYAKHAEDAFTALGLSTATIDNIKGLKEEDFPTEKVQSLQKHLLEEQGSMIKFLQTDITADMEDIKAKLEKQGKNWEETARDVKDLRNFLLEQSPFFKPLKSHLFPKIPNFTGRVKECDEIINHLTNQPTRLVSVWGSPGFGKTSVGVAVGHELDSQGHVVLSRSLQGVKSVSEMAQRILILSPQSEQTSKEKAQDRVLQWLSSVPIPLYLFLDNADDLLASKDELLKFLRDVLTSSQKVKLLLTTRESLEFADVWFSTATVRINSLDKSASKEVVRKILPKAPDDAIDSITNTSGDVPLAIKLVCSIVSTDGRLCPNWKKMMIEISSSPTDGLNTSIYPDEFRIKVLFEHCFRSLSTDQQKAFVSLSVFNDSFDVPAAMAVLNLEEELAINKILKELEMKSLLQRDSLDSSVTIHPLLRSFGVSIGDEEMKQVFQDAKSRFFGYYLSVLEMLNTQFHTGQSSSALRLFLKDQQSIILSLSKGITSDKHYDTAVQVLSQAEMFLDLIFWYDNATLSELYDDAIEQAQDRQQALDHFQHLVSKAFVYLTWSDGKSKRLLQEAEKLQDMHSFPVEMKERLQCYQGIDLIIRGETDDGVRLLQGAYAIQVEKAITSVTKVLIKKLLELCDSVPKNPQTCPQKTDEEFPSDVQNSPTLLFMEMPGNAPGEDQPFMLQMIFLFNAVCKRVKIKKPKEIMTKCVLEIRTQLEISLGDAVCVSPFYTTVNGVLAKLGEVDQAIRGLTKMLLYQEDAIQKASIYHALGMLQFKNGDHEGALESLTRAAEMRQKLLGEHEHTAHSYSELGSAQFRLADYKGAVDSHTKAVAMRQHILGEHEDTAHSYYHLGCAQFA